MGSTGLRPARAPVRISLTPRRSLLSSKPSTRAMLRPYESHSVLAYSFIWFILLLTPIYTTVLSIFYVLYQHCSYLTVLAGILGVNKRDRASLPEFLLILSVVALSICLYLVNYCFARILCLSRLICRTYEAFGLLLQVRRFSLSYMGDSLLDPRISYAGLKHDFEFDYELTEHLEESKQHLNAHFRKNYAHRVLHTSAASAQSSSDSTTPSSSSPRKNFTARYRVSRPVQDELDVYFSRPQEDWDKDPLQWWYDNRKTFPSLFLLARDILCIPGSAVAVERIFSSGRDTVSVRRANLSAATIRTLMIVKHRLRMAREISV
ncbi:hATC-domain-containing protein [Peniophora sp. CONT]|nr:hATC-domain-containing protein [Peniophora sp. CONT]